MRLEKSGIQWQRANEAEGQELREPKYGSSRVRRQGTETDRVHHIKEGRLRGTDNQIETEIEVERQPVLGLVRVAPVLVELTVLLL